MFWLVLMVIIGVILVSFGTAEPTVKKVPYNADAEGSKFALIVNKDFEEELYRKISLPSYREKILDVIKDDLKYIYGSVWKNLYSGCWQTPQPVTTAFNSVENIILMLMLSKSGFIPCCYRWGQLSISNFDVANSYECLKILHCVEKNIQAKRAASIFSLVFLPDVIFRRDSKNKVQEYPQYDYPCSGKFYWSFQSNAINSKYKIKDIHDAGLVQSCINSSIGTRSEKKNPYKNTLVL